MISYGVGVAKYITEIRAGWYFLVTTYIFQVKFIQTFTPASAITK